MAKVPLNVRVDPALLEALKVQAKRENRPLSNLIETLLKRYLEDPKRLASLE